MNYTVKEITCQSGDNPIYGVMYLPQNVNGKIPMAILNHGYNSSYSHLTDMAERLAQKGIGGYCFDFCGGSSISKSGGRSVDMSIRTEQDDLKCVIGMIKDSDIADTKKIFLYGESQGGFVSALTAAEMKEDIAAMALLYPAFCIPDNWLLKNPEELKNPIDFMGMTLSERFYYGVPDYDVFKHISSFDKPVLIMHGTADGLVDISYSQKACSHFPHCTLDIYENEGHGFSPAAREKMCEKTVQFFSGLC